MKYLTYLTYLAYILVILGAILYLPMREMAPYVFAVGCLLQLGSHFAERYHGTNLRQKRLTFIRHLVGVIYLASGYFMVFKTEMSWLVLLTIAVVLDLYTLYVKE